MTTSMEPHYEVVWPLGKKARGDETFTPRLNDLNGKVIAEVWDWMYRGDESFPLVREELKRRYPDITIIEYPVFGDIHGVDEVEAVERVSRLLVEHGCDGVIVGIGHCGTCTPAVVRASLAAERVGVPSVSIVGKNYVEMATVVSRLLGVEDLPLAVYPGDIKFDELDEFVRKYETSVCDEIVEQLLTGDPKSGLDRDEPKPRDIVFSGSLDSVNDHFYREQWTDGLPIVPPTVDRIEGFLRAIERAPEEVVGVLLPEQREVTVWNVAVTAVMAGCRPEYMPMLLAVASAMADPAFKAEDGGSGTAWEPLIIVSGPVIEQLDINFGTGAMRVGRQANTSIGRFAKLLMLNIAGVRFPPGKTDKSAIGMTFPVVLAENEAAARRIGWPTFGDDRGVAAGQSAVTLQSVSAVSPPLFYGRPSQDSVFSYLEPVVEVFGQGILGYWCFTGLKFGNWHPTIVFSPKVASMVADMGWSKDDLRRWLYEKSVVPARHVEGIGVHMALDLAAKVQAGEISPDYHRSDDPDRLVSTFVRPEWIKIVIAGNPDGPVQQGYMNNHGQGIPVTRLIER